MKKGFLKFKKRYRAGVTLKSLAFGISVGIIVASVMWLVAKLSAQVPNYILYAAVGGGLALLLSTVSYVLFLPTEKKIAKYTMMNYPRKALMSALLAELKLQATPFAVIASKNIPKKKC